MSQDLASNFMVETNGKLYANKIEKKKNWWKEEFANTRITEVRAMQ